MLETIWSSQVAGLCVRDRTKGKRGDEPPEAVMLDLKREDGVDRVEEERREMFLQTVRYAFWVMHRDEA
jgi:hypothetical protein